MLLVVKDYLTGSALASGQFKGFWDTIGADPKISEKVQNFQLPFKTMEAAVQGVIKFLGMYVCDGSDKINVTDKTHNVLLSGMFYGREMVLVRGKIGFNQEYGCILNMTVRSTNESITSTMLEAIN